VPFRLVSDYEKKDINIIFYIDAKILEHIYPEDYNKVFSEWKRVIKEGGHFIVSVPYLNAYDDPCHVNYFDENNLSELFTQQGFEVVECYRDNREGFDCLIMVSKVNKNAN
jgi:threonyl-tRNA synthetase